MIADLIAEDTVAPAHYRWKILIVDSNLAERVAVAEELTAAGIVCAIEATVRSALERCRREAFDLLVVDLHLPDGSGLECLEQLRRLGNQTPIILLSPRHELDERINALRAGAEDCLARPFAVEELLARGEAILRRVLARSRALQLRSGELTLDIANRRVNGFRGSASLTQTEFRILQCLMRAAGHVVTREHLAEEVWHSAWDPATNVVDVHIARLRRKLGRNRIESAIVTVWGQGYAVRG